MKNIQFTPRELARYSRHLAMPEFNIEGQRKLKAASVLVIGAGGLGSPSLLYLAAAGVGHIGIVDFDTIDDSNLQRQVLYTVEEIGQSKAKNAKKRLLKLNPHIKITVHETAFTSENALEIIADYDVVADGTDNFPTRYLVNDACVLTGKVNVYASIFRFEGQVAVFNGLRPDGTRGPNYRDLFPEPPPPGMVPSCAEGGVLGVLPGIIGSMQANEVIKIITGVGEPLIGRLFLFDAASFTTRVLKIPKNPSIQIKELIDYDQFCGFGTKEPRAVKSVSVQAFAQMQASGADFQLIDVREPYEFEIVNIQGTLIPLASITSEKEKIASDKKVIIHCRTGKRSADAIRMLEDQFGFEHLYNLEGGINKYAKEIDSSLSTY